MKRLRRLIPLFLVCSFLLSGLTKAAAQDANIYVILPPSSQSYWNITFTSTITWQQYQFNTGPAQSPTGYLGYLSPGNYDVHFSGFYFNDFTYSIGNNAYQGGQIAGSYCSFYNVPIINVTTISIQALTQ